MNVERGDGSYIAPRSTDQRRLKLMNDFELNNNICVTPEG